MEGLRIQVSIECLKGAQGRLGINTPAGVPDNKVDGVEALAGETLRACGFSCVPGCKVPWLRAEMVARREAIKIATNAGYHHGLRHIDSWREGIGPEFD